MLTGDFRHLGLWIHEALWEYWELCAVGCLSALGPLEWTPVESLGS
jgi:hypothetical protein